LNTYFALLPAAGKSPVCCLSVDGLSGLGKLNVAAVHAFSWFEEDAMEKDRPPPSKAVDDEDPDYSPMTQRGPDGRAHKTPTTEAAETVPQRDDGARPRAPIVPSNPD
jgi:hypothetical protein